MDNYKIFITDSLANYDKNQFEQKKMLKNEHHINFIDTNDDINNNKIRIFDNNNRLICTADYEEIGTYDMGGNLWAWAWSNPSSSKKVTKIIRNLLNYGFSLDVKKDYNLKLELTNSRNIITDTIQIDIYLAIASELSKIPNVYKIAIPKDTREWAVRRENNELDYDVIKDYEYQDAQFKILYIFLFNIKK